MALRFYKAVWRLLQKVYNHDFFCQRIVSLTLVVCFFIVACSMGGNPIEKDAEPGLSDEEVPITITTQSQASHVKRPAMLPDSGIWPDLNEKAWLHLSPAVKGKIVRIVVDKPHRVISLLADNLPVISYPIALGFDPRGTKIKQGDGRTPEGSYYLCELLHENLPAKYGKRSMLLSYPGSKDAVRGREMGLIILAPTRSETPDSVI